ncbi:MAG: Transcriptional regulatory protein YehT [Flavobacteriia bacterium]|nr:MAG: Transcriptional regulatory protein YehT [Flavobacteriia bacterium]
MKAILIDDEAKGRSALKNLLTLLDDSVQVVAEASSVAEGVALIDDSEPELVFLDIQMDDGTGFDVLEQVRYKDFQLIFVTAHDEYALRAFRYSAIDYLTKPVDPDLLQDALLKVRENSEKYDLNLKLEALVQNRSKVQKLALPSLKGIELVKKEEVVRCESSNNYTVFHLKDKKQIVVTKTLKEFEEMLSPEGFFRIHQSHLVNLDAVVRFLKEDGGYALMEDGTRVEVSRRKKEAFVQAISGG